MNFSGLLDSDCLEYPGTRHSVKGGLRWYISQSSQVIVLRAESGCLDNSEWSIMKNSIFVF